MSGGKLVRPSEFLRSAGSTPRAVWGKGEEVLWSSGEPLIVTGPPGVGKSTLTHQLLLRRSGVHGGDLLGWPVEVDARRVLLVAADRPRQQARSMGRMLSHQDECNADSAITIWSELLPFDLGATDGPQRLLDFVKSVPQVGTVVLDSLGALVSGLSEDLRGGNVARGLQALVQAEYEVLAVHHPRKAQSENSQPRKLDDMYGARWLSTGAGSVLSLWGEGGDEVISMTHVKQPCEAVGPLKLLHDHKRGVTTLYERTDPLEQIRRSPDPLSAPDVARRISGLSAPSDAEVARARRRLAELERRGLVKKFPGSAGSAATYVATKEGS